MEAREQVSALNVHDEIYRRMEANSQRMYGGARGGTVPAQSAGGDIPSQLSQLDDLRKRGVTTEQKFAAKKAELLKRM